MFAKRGGWISVVPALLVFSVGTSHAQSGADLLLNSGQSVENVSKGRPANKKAKRKAGAIAPLSVAPAAGILPENQLVLNDAVLRALYPEVSERLLGARTPYELKQWWGLLFGGKTREAAHLIRSIEPKVTGALEAPFAVAKAYLVFRSGLPQSFFNDWLALARSKEFRSSTLGLALTGLMGSDSASAKGDEALRIESFLTAHAIQLNPTQEAWIESMPNQGQAYLPILKAWALRRKGLAAEAILPILPDQSRVKSELALNVALQLALSNQIAKSGSILKKYAEPAAASSSDPQMASKLSLQMARLLYQAGALDAAEAYYDQVPSGSPEYLRAREELLWVWLRQGNAQSLRGGLKTLESKVFANFFAPEVEVVRAISNLKLCNYAQVEKDITAFVEKNGRYVRQIQDSIRANGNVPTPAVVDPVSLSWMNAADARRAELGQLESLAQESIQAVVPAVGVQGHWRELVQTARQSLQTAEKARDAEFRRQWKRMAQELQEAIRKMRFVKVELMSQLYQVAKGTIVPPQQDTVARSQAGLLKTDEEEMAFPFDGVVWTDELFRLRGIAQSRCVGLGDAK